MKTSLRQDHSVQLYPDDPSLISSLHDFIAKGLLAGDPCIVIATQAHRQALEVSLRQVDIDLSDYQATGQYKAFDAQETLNLFVVNGLPLRAKFYEVIGGLLKEATASGRPVKAFGEMVALLWQQDNQAGAILLEQLWNDIGRDYPLTLFCAYPHHYFGDHGHYSVVREVMRLHTKTVLPSSAIGHV